MAGFSLKPSKYKPRKATNPHRCGSCGHSRDLHDKQGCRVTDIFTKEKCDCEGIK